MLVLVATAKDEYRKGIGTGLWRGQPWAALPLTRPSLYRKCIVQNVMWMPRQSWTWAHSCTQPHDIAKDAKNTNDSTARGQALRGADRQANGAAGCRGQPNVRRRRGPAARLQRQR